MTATDAPPTGWVFVTDDDPGVRKALGRLLRSAGFAAKAFASGEDFLREPLPDAPACAVLDVHLPGLDGLDLQRALADKDATLPVVFITGYGDIPTTVRAMRAGAVDFLPKPFDARDLLAAVRLALARHTEARQAGAGLLDLRQRYESLSPREREVFVLVVGGLLNKQAGLRLHITERTIKEHRAQIMHKMRADSLADLVRMAGRLGIDFTAPPSPSSPAVPPAAIS
jgi:FixJ family two-component response regulator